MAEHDLPARVAALIRQSIDSIAELEAVLLLREHSGQEWSAQELGVRLYVSTAVAAYILATFAARGFFRERSDRYQYDPATAGLRADIDALAAAYSANLIVVTNLIHAKPTRSVRDFAKAFQIRRDT